MYAKRGGGERLERIEAKKRLNVRGKQTEIMRFRGYRVILLLLYSKFEWLYWWWRWPAAAPSTRPAGVSGQKRVWRGTRIYRSTSSRSVVVDRPHIVSHTFNNTRYHPLPPEGGVFCFVYAAWETRRFLDILSPAVVFFTIFLNLYILICRVPSVKLTRHVENRKNCSFTANIRNCAVVYRKNDKDDDTRRTHILH